MDKEKIRWDSIIITLVNLQLRTGRDYDKNSFHFDLEKGVIKKPSFEERRSPEEFQSYLRELFDKPSQVAYNNWHFAARKKRKRKYWD